DFAPVAAAGDRHTAGRQFKNDSPTLQRCDARWLRIRYWRSWHLFAPVRRPHHADGDQPILAGHGYQFLAQPDTRKQRLRQLHTPPTWLDGSDRCRCSLIWYRRKWNHTHVNSLSLSHPRSHLSTAYWLTEEDI